MWSIEGTALELTYNYGTEAETFGGYHPGNEEKDGFGHIAFNVNDVYSTCEKMEAAGVSFKKKPDEGRYVILPYTFLLRILSLTFFKSLTNYHKFKG